MGRRPQGLLALTLTRSTAKKGVYGNGHATKREVARAVVARYPELKVYLSAAMPLPPRADLEALAADLPRLWHASTTAPKDRKRILRTLIADVTLISAPARDAVRVGIHWRSGATKELLVRRPAPTSITRRTPTGAIDFVRQRRDTSDGALVLALNAAGFKTGTGRSFDVAAVRWLRFAYRIASSSLRRSLLENSPSLTSRPASESRRVLCIIGWPKASSTRGAIIAAGGACPSPPTSRRRVVNEC